MSAFIAALKPFATAAVYYMITADYRIHSLCRFDLSSCK